ncbi:tetratricopeptide repeat protein [Archangium sp.]|uniref:J domain-containing protein n=1 Tax=Archangium sp. TaxID=1872627 RepID=UPI002D51F182|nr:tetratricopeptide repeat protein [Archangium sp.]HYO59944.1 tetratricopeptide repeat protein [Archangium sp.]
MARIAEAAELQDGELILTASPIEVGYLSGASAAPFTTGLRTGAQAEASLSEVAPTSEVWVDAFPTEPESMAGAGGLELARSPGIEELPVQEDTDALRLAREQANAALMQDMQEAVRRAGATAPESWLIEEPAPSTAPVAAAPAAPSPEVPVSATGAEPDFWADLAAPEPSVLAVPSPVAPAPAAPPPAVRPPPAAPPRAAVPPGLRSPAVSALAPTTRGPAPATGAPAPAASVPPGLRSPAANAPAPAARGPVPATSAPAPATSVPPNLSVRGSAPAAPAPTQPSRLGPDPSRPTGDDELWRIVTIDNAHSGEAPGDINASFEAALQQVDAHRESLGGTEVPQVVEPAPVAASPSPAPAPPPAPAAPVQAGGPNVPEALDELSFDEDDLADEPSDEAAKVRRQRLLQRAMELGSRPAPEAPTAPAAPPPSPGAPAPLSPEEQQLAQLIEKRYEDVQAKRDYFTTLGLPIDPEVKREQVKTAFLGLAKRFHPDRLPPALSSLAPRMPAIFEAIRDSYEALYDDQQRAAYLQELRSKSLAQASPRPSGGVDPNDLFKMGEVFFRKRDFAAAVDHFERAFNAEPRAVYLAARAWAIYMDPQRKAESPKTKQMMLEALKMDPNCDRAHYQLGVIARVEGDMDRAERHFREAVRANPKHLEANQELRLIEMRKKNPTPKKGGLFR